ncbi:MAG: hypothetical protein Q8O40_13340 [Chloroflexota bacterium]|nr:hypothetical protein [Chloroflexota bacterium]
MAAIVGVTQKTIDNWEKGTRDGNFTNACTPDLRLKVPKALKRAIAEKAALDKGQVHRIGILLRQAKAANMQQIEKVPIYNVWNVPKCDPRFGLDYPRRIPCKGR